MLFLLTFFLTVVSDLKFGTTWLDTSKYEVTLILYSILLTSAFIKMLNTLRLRNSISFIVRMLTNVFINLIPFLSLFLAMILAFMFIQVILGL